MRERKKKRGREKEGEGRNGECKQATPWIPFPSRAPIFALSALSPVSQGLLPPSPSPELLRPVTLAS